jgi:hypothetical protein
MINSNSELNFAKANDDLRLTKTKEGEVTMADEQNRK